MEILIVLFVLWLVAYGSYKLALLIFRPDVFMLEKRIKHEREMAVRQRNLQAMGLAGLVVRLLTGR